MAKKPPKKASGTDYSKIMKTLANSLGGVGLASIAVAIAWVPLLGPFLSAGLLWLNMRILQPSSSAPSSVSAAVSSKARPSPPPDINIDGYPAPTFPEFRCELTDDVEYFGIYESSGQGQGGAVIQVSLSDTRYARAATIRLLWQGDKKGKQSSYTSERYFDSEYFYCDIDHFFNKDNDDEEFDGFDSSTIIFRLLDDETLQLVSGNLGTIANGTILKKI